MRTRVARALLAVMAGWLVPGTASAGVITVTYEITGGQAFGNFLGLDNARIQSGTVIVTMPNPGSGPPAISTISASIYFKLTGTNGAMLVLQTEANRFVAEGSYGPAQADSFRWFDRTPNANFSHFTEITLSVSVGGNVVNGKWVQGILPPQQDQRGFRNLVGREVSAPEPASGSLALAGLLALAGCGGAARIARWLSERTDSAAPSA